MFVEFQASNNGSTGNGNGLRSFAYVLDYVLTSNASSLTTAINQGLVYYVVYSDQNPGLWTRRETVGDFDSSATAPGEYWAYSQRVIGKPDQAFYHKGFALRWNAGTTSVGFNNYFNGFMGAFQDPADRTNFASFDFARPLNWPLTNTATNSVSFAHLNSNNRSVSADRYIMSAAEGYMFIGNLDQGTFWAVVDGTTLPIHEYTSSAAIPMLGLTGAGDNGNSLTRHDLRIHVHKYDSGAGTAYNQLSSFNQQINGDSTSAPNTVNFLNLYPSSLANQGFPNRFDADGKRTTALYPIIIGNPIRGNAYQTTEGLLILSGQDHVTGQTFYVGSSRYYKFVCTHDRTNRLPAFSGLTIGVPIR
jgi:hypothetical protein